jgi:hypothetical protein
MYESFIPAYEIYFSSNPNSLLTHICEILYNFDHRIGGMFGCAPAHYVVMSNLLIPMPHASAASNIGDEEIAQDGYGDEGHEEGFGGWTKWDLKPTSFWEPTRDLIPDSIKTGQMITGLADGLSEDDRMVLSMEQKSDLMLVLPFPVRSGDTGFSTA